MSVGHRSLRARLSPLRWVLALVMLATALAASPAFAAERGAESASGATAGAPMLVPAEPVPDEAKKASSKSGSKAESKPKKKRAKLRELKARSEQLAADLEAGTAALEQTEELRDEAKRQRKKLTEQAQRARAVADQAHEDLGKFASAAYRGQQVPLDISVLVAPRAETSDTLHTLATLTHTGEIQNDIATLARESAEEASRLEAAAVRAAAVAEAATIRAAEQVKALKKLARQNRKQLAAEVERLERVAARKLAAQCRDRATAAGRYPNGLIPQDLLCEIGVGQFKARGDAAAAFKELAAAYAKDHGTICVTDAYRSLGSQEQVYREKPELAAVPGRSKHGLGLAVDLCGGIQTSGTAQHKWMQDNAGDFGWFHPDWAQLGGSLPEAWHWEYSPELYESRESARKERRSGS